MLKRYTAVYAGIHRFLHGLPPIPKGPTRNCYRPHYAGKRAIASERNRRRIERGFIPADQVLRPGGGDA